MSVSIVSTITEAVRRAGSGLLDITTGPAVYAYDPPDWYGKVFILGMVSMYVYYVFFINDDETVKRRMEQDDFERRVGLK